MHATRRPIKPLVIEAARPRNAAAAALRAGGKAARAHKRKDRDAIPRRWRLDD